jgi:O-acetyl-ADP-ribose deacetylase (regulator of RNase III)
MIEYKTGDILTEDVEALVNTVNCVGIMGRGVALQFKNAFPENFKSYYMACKRNEVQPGRMFVFETGRLTNPRYIINFPTKRHWRGQSKIEDIEIGLSSLAEEIKDRNILSIAIPPLGSGLGGLQWSKVRPYIEAALKKFGDTRIIVFEPYKSKDTHVVRTKKVPQMTSGRAALVMLMHCYHSGLLDPFITLLEIHKLMYFMQQAGEPLRLTYTKGTYGPYAENLRHVLNAIEGYLVSGYANGGDMPNKQLTLVPGAFEDALISLKDKAETKERYEKVCNLVEGFESPFGLELLSTVHWIINNEKVHDVDEVISKTYEWHDRKKQYSKRQIAIAIDVLAQKGWIKNSKAQSSL